MYTQNKIMTWIGWILTILVAGMLFMSAFMKFAEPPEVRDAFVGKMGYPEGALPLIGIVELACAALFLIPRTATLGAVLLTGYLGGAVATHVRITDDFFAPVLVGVFVWLALFLRDPRVRAVLPFRSRLPVVDPATGQVTPAKESFGRVILGLIPVVLLGGLLALLAVVASQPAEFRVERSMKMAAPPQEIFEQINNFHNWEAWSPWAKLDPNAAVTFEGPEQGPGAVFAWSGNNEVGVGKMTILDSKPGQFVKIKLDFVKPMPGTSYTLFTFTPVDDDGATKVTWTMTGKNSLVGRAMCMMMDMDEMVGGQFEKGLANIKAIVEKK